MGKDKRPSKDQEDQENNVIEFKTRKEREKAKARKRSLERLLKQAERLGW